MSSKNIVLSAGEASSLESESNLASRIIKVTSHTTSNRKKSNSFSSSSSSTSGSPVVDYFDEYDHYLFDNEKYFNVGHGGKQRGKREVELNSNRHDPSGNTRIIMSKMQNLEHKRRSHK